MSIDVHRCHVKEPKLQQIVKAWAEKDEWIRNLLFPRMNFDIMDYIMIPWHDVKVT